MTRELYDLKSSTASKAELHAAVASLRGRGHGLPDGLGEEYSSSGSGEAVQTDLSLLRDMFKTFDKHYQAEAEQVMKRNELN
jgi:hypothetical protein